MNIKFLGVQITPNPVETGKQFLLAVSVETPGEHRVLASYSHAELAQHTHDELKDEVT